MQQTYKDDVFYDKKYWQDKERSGSVIEYLTQDQEAAGSSLIGFTALSP